MPTFLFALCMCVLEAGTGPLDKVLNVVPQLFNLASTCFNMILDNAILLLYFSPGIIAVGFAIFRMMKKAATR